MRNTTPRWILGCFVTLVAHLLGSAVTRAGEVCLCNGEVTDDGNNNVQDAAAIIDCVRGDCSACVNSCDVNCDGRVDFVDMGVQWCQFEMTPGGDPESCCTEATGACSIPNDRFNTFPTCFITLRAACEFWAIDQNEGGAYLGDGTTPADCGVPTVSEWGIVALTLTLMIGGTLVIRTSART